MLSKKHQFVRRAWITGRGYGEYGWRMSRAGAMGSRFEKFRCNSRMTAVVKTWLLM